MERFADYRLGETAEPVLTTTSAELRDATLSMVSQGRRGVEIISRHLDPPLYDDAGVVEALKALALSSPRARIRILVQDLTPILRDGHRLVNLAQRLTSFIDVRVPAPHHRDFNQAILVVDETGFIQRELADRYEALVNFADPGTARRLQQTFEELWATAQPDPNLRVMRL